MDATIQSPMQGGFVFHFLCTTIPHPFFLMMPPEPCQKKTEKFNFFFVAPFLGMHSREEIQGGGGAGKRCVVQERGVWLLRFASVFEVQFTSHISGLLKKSVLFPRFLSRNISY
jgi:hypothetical protein